MFSRLRSGKIFKSVPDIFSNSPSDTDKGIVELNRSISLVTLDTNSDSDFIENKIQVDNHNIEESYGSSEESPRFSIDHSDKSFEHDFLGFFFPPIMAKLDNKFALNMIPEFDGSNVRELDRFISCCEYVLENLEENEEKNLLKLLHRKLIGRAHDVLVYNDFETFTDFKDEMISQFGPSQSKEVLELELLNVRQDHGEDIRKYSNKIEQTLSLLNSTCTLGESKEVAKAIRKLNERTALKAFEVGLRDPVRTIVLASRYKTLKESINGAIEHESLFAQKQLATQNNSNKNNSSHIKCHTCNKVGHISKNCASRNSSNSSNSFQINSKSNIRNSDNFNPQKKKFCNYCKNLGHVIDECRKRQYYNSLSSKNSNTTNNVKNIQEAGNDKAPEPIQPSTSVRVRDLI